jgi:hypothetical protein
VASTFAALAIAPAIKLLQFAFLRGCTDRGGEGGGDSADFSGCGGGASVGGMDADRGAVQPVRLHMLQCRRSQGGHTCCQAKKWFKVHGATSDQFKMVLGP